MAVYLNGEEVGVVNNVVETVEGGGGMSIKSEILTAENAYTRLTEIIDSGKFKGLKLTATASVTINANRLTINLNDNTFTMAATGQNLTPSAIKDVYFATYYRYGTSYIWLEDNNYNAYITSTGNVSISYQNNSYNSSNNACYIDFPNTVNVSNNISNGSLVVTVEYFE